MSRPSSVSSARNLSLTEELEKLEQSITLTLQEIDHNFSRAHRIVTTSILPIVEQYAEHSKAVWEGSKFWKQFFEASANVSLSGYEELAHEEEEEEDTSLSQSQGHDRTYETSTGHDDETITNEHTQTYDHDEESMLDENDLSGSTPRAPRSRSGDMKPQFADYPSSYETLKRELKGTSSKHTDENEEEDEYDTQVLPTTPGTLGTQRLPDMSMTPLSSPFAPTSYLTTSNKGVDPLLHRVLDKNYRLQATPHSTRKIKTPVNKPSWRDSESPMSSPPEAAPQLHADIFSSPIRQQYNRPPAPRTPGVSVQTPAKGKSRDIFAGDRTEEKQIKDEITWESDSDNDADAYYKELGMSPPKTIQFSLPQSRLLQTPAREASKRIVEDLLFTAGVGGTDDSDELDSPSMVKMKDDILDDSF